jgi:hypothetical protein
MRTPWMAVILAIASIGGGSLSSSINVFSFE